MKTTEDQTIHIEENKQKDKQNNNWVKAGFIGGLSVFLILAGICINDLKGDTKPLKPGQSGADDIEMIGTESDESVKNAISLSVSYNGAEVFTGTGW